MAVEVDQLVAEVATGVNYAVFGLVIEIAAETPLPPPPDTVVQQYRPFRYYPAIETLRELF